MVVTDFTKMLTLDDLEIGMKVSFHQLGNIYDIPIYLKDFEIDKGVNGCGVICSIGESINLTEEDVRVKHIVLVCNKYDEDDDIDEEDFDE